jgi:glycosyltransferase involved in cell wall biosynthesis
MIPQRKADMHVHSKFSSRPSQWILQKLGCPESFTEPACIYERATSAGMDYVTITDHNVIEGGLEIAHLPGVFLSEEVTTYFPEDRCKLHVLVYGISETQHGEIQRLRENVFDLCGYLRREGLVHALAHPLFAVNDKLSVDHFEQALLLFDIFELNGCRDNMQNQVLESILADLDRVTMEVLADRHDLEPLGSMPWQKGLIGGSDDHSGLNIASMHTLAAAENLRDFLGAVEARRARPTGRTATGHALARNLYAIAYQYYRARTKRTHSKMLCMQFADHMLGAGHNPGDGILARLHTAIGTRRSSTYLRLTDAEGLRALLLKEVTRIIEADRSLTDIAKGKPGADFDREWFRCVGLVSDKLISTFLDRLLTSALGANIFDIFSTIGTAGSLYALLAPYFVSFGLFARERSFSRTCARAFGQARPQPLTLLHFTDTFEDVNGVSWTIRQQLEMALDAWQAHDGGHLRARSKRPRTESLRPHRHLCHARISGTSIAYPPFLRMLEYTLEADAKLILSATPGPVGLAALAISRILQIPIHGTYHTAFPQYVASLTGDSGLEELTRKYMAWYYKQMDVVYAPSQAIADELAGFGVERGAIRVYPRGVDTGRFDPAKRNGFYKAWPGMDTFKLIYVGRISREKDLDILAAAFKKTLARMNGSRHKPRHCRGRTIPEEMERDLAGLPALFTGVLHGERLAEAYASADLFVFPSTTDTFGNVVLEAQASGLPVIVSDRGGPMENIHPGRTGLVVRGRDVDDLAQAMLGLCADPERVKRMGEDARMFAEERSFGTAFLATWELYRNVTTPAA